MHLATNTQTCSGSLTHIPKCTRAPLIHTQTHHMYMLLCLQVMVGPGTPRAPKTASDAAVAAFLDGATSGAVLVAFGSTYQARQGEGDAKYRATQTRSIPLILSISISSHLHV